MTFLDSLQRSPMLVDAGMGTRLIARGLDLNREDPCLWNRQRPEVVEAIHRLDREAGADALFTNTFGAHSVAETNEDIDRINRAAVEIARRVVGAAGIVIGSLGPRPFWSAPDFRQLSILTSSGVDALVLETAQPDQLVTALEAIRNRTTLPLIVSVFARPEPKIWQRFRDLGADVVGVNCLSDFEAIDRILEDAAWAVDLPLFVKPSGGLPGGSIASPEDFSSAAEGWLGRGVRLLGGCCGTTERHIGALRGLIDRISL